MSTKLAHILLLALLLLPAWAAEPAPAPAAAFHPRIKLLDAVGSPVVTTGAPMSAMITCGACHDTWYIATHEYHGNAGLSAFSYNSDSTSLRPWDASPGLYGRWDPLTYLLPEIKGEGAWEDRVRWESALGFRHTGGGPGLDTGRAQVEFNCLLCHLVAPDNTARTAELRQESFAWATTATLAQTGLVRRQDGAWRWDATRFAADGTVAAEQLGLSAPRSESCGQCHGTVYSGKVPLALHYNLGNWSTETTGQVYSAQRINATALNLQDKAQLSRPLDIHAERLLGCTDCHSAPNNPVLGFAPERTRPENLLFDPRKLTLGEYLLRPRHDFAKGYSAQGLSDPGGDGSMQRCEDCHDALQTHAAWLPYAKRHLRALACETCHIPEVYAPARSVTDWTLPDAAGNPRIEYRGGAGGVLTADSIADPARMWAGYQPVLLPRLLPGQPQQLAPFNLGAAWYWIGDVKDLETGLRTQQPVSREMLRKALYPQGVPAPALLKVLDADGDGLLSAAERKLSTAAQVTVVAELLKQAGLANPRISAELLPYDLHHSVATAEWALKDCNACHARDSRLSAPLALAANVPGDAMPELVGDTAHLRLAGRLTRDAAGEISYAPSTGAAGLYILGHDRWKLGDLLGLAAVCLALLAAGLHGGLRIAQALRGKGVGR